MKKAHRTATSLFQRSALWAALSLSIFGNAQALTLNRPIVQSKQGEALRAEIDISEITLAEQIELQASMASPEIYKAAKIDLPTSNGQPVELEVQLLRRDHGTPYLKITSHQAITGNSIDLLIDISWATGRLLRDLSVSLDENKPAAKSINMPGIADSMPLPNTSRSQINVKRGDTASGLTADKTPDGVSLDQMLLALLRNNPDAFVDSNINRMKEGALLTLPTEQDAKAISREEARREIQVQAKDFEAYRAELAAHAPGGTTPKVARDAEGKLEATVKNKNSKANQDKLTLTKPGKKDSAVEEKIAEQLQAQDVATRAAELSRNIAELGKIAADTVAGSAPDAVASATLPIEVPASAAQPNDQWLDELRENTLTPWGAGGLIVLLILVGLWRRRANKASHDNIQGLPPLNVKFNLDLPDHDHAEPIERAYIHDVASHTHDSHDHVTEDQHDETMLAHQDVAARPTMEMPNISLDLDEPDHHASPYQVRIDLADELWNLGQLHTSRALMEEVANEASGSDKEKALKWLAERG